MYDDRGKGILLTTVTPYASFDGMTRDLAEALRAVGMPCDVLTLDAIEADRAGFVERMRTWRPKPPRFVLAWNAKLHIRCDGASIHEAFGVPLVTPLLDHPAFHYEHLIQTPSNAVVGIVDRRHRPYLADNGFKHAAAVFFPHGGPKPDPAPKPMCGRKTQVLLCGTLAPPPDLRPAVAALAPPSFASKVDALTRRLIDRCMTEGMDPARICRDEFRAAGFDATAPTLALAFAHLVTELCTYITQDWRVRLLNALKRAQVTVRGTLDSRTPIRNRGNLAHLGVLPFRDVPAAFGDAKIVLNVTPKFLDGSHERIFYGMAAGAAIATDANAYLAEFFAPRHDLLYLPGTPELAAEIIDETASDDALLQSLADRARPIYARAHTWSARARVLVDALAALQGAA